MIEPVFSLAVPIKYFSYTGCLFEQPPDGWNLPRIINIDMSNLVIGNRKRTAGSRVEVFPAMPFY